MKDIVMALILVVGMVVVDILALIVAPSLFPTVFILGGFWHMLVSLVIVIVVVAIIMCLWEKLRESKKYD